LGRSATAKKKKVFSENVIKFSRHYGQESKAWQLQGLCATSTGLFPLVFFVVLAEHNEICYGLEGNCENVVHRAPCDMFML